MISLFAKTAAGILLSRFARSWLAAMEKAAPDAVDRHMAYATTRNQKRVLDAIEAISGRSLLAFTSERRTGITPEISTLRPLRHTAQYWRDAWRFGREFSGPSHQRIYAALRALRVLCFRREAQVLLANRHCRALFLFNDHIGECRAMAFAAKNIGAESIYVPHASVSSRFPSLAPFTRALLDGERSAAIYAPKRGQCKITVVGSIRNYALHLMRLNRTNDGRSREAIGVGINYETIPGRLDALLRKLHEAGKWMILIRPSPAMLTKGECAPLLRNVIRRPDVVLDQNSLPEFVARIRFLLSDSSSIHLDSLAAGTPTYYVDLDELDDYYGFGDAMVVQRYMFDDPEDELLRSYLQDQIAAARVYDRFFEVGVSSQLECDAQIAIRQAVS